MMGTTNVVNEMCDVPAGRARIREWVSARVDAWAKRPGAEPTWPREYRCVCAECGAQARGSIDPAGAYVPQGWRVVLGAQGAIVAVCEGCITQWAVGLEAMSADECEALADWEDCLFAASCRTEPRVPWAVGNPRAARADDEPGDVDPADYHELHTFALCDPAAPGWSYDTREWGRPLGLVGQRYVEVWGTLDSPLQFEMNLVGTTTRADIVRAARHECEKAGENVNILGVCVEPQGLDDVILVEACER